LCIWLIAVYNDDMKYYRFPIAVLCAATICALLSCSSVPSAKPNTEPEIKVRLAPVSDILRHGVGNDGDPFSVPMKLMNAFDAGRPEFVVLAIDLTLPQAMHIAIDADVKSESGDIVAQLYSKEELRAFWKNYLASDDPFLVKRLQTIDWYYAPSSDFQAKRGHKEYYVVCAGKGSVPRPAEAEIFITLDDGAPQSFYFPLPVAGK
jgi:hypothetical protein